MELFAPEYYKRFVCIADKCKHSCCIGWEIDVDETSLKKYEALGDGYANEVRKSISREDGTPRFKMCEDGRCPHLDGRGLCKMITELGEESLADICREHPRFYNAIGERCEVGVGAACEVAARLILDSDGYDSIVKVGDSDSPCQDFDEPSVFLRPYTEKNSPIAIRKAIYEILKDEATPYRKRLEKIYSECGVSPAALTNKKWRAVIDELEYLDPESRERFGVFKRSLVTAKGAEPMLARFLAYLVFRHVSPAKTETELRLSLGFAFFAERLLASLVKEEGVENIYELARIISEELEYSEDNVESIKLEFL